ncbi:hypothetical protein K2173_024936 [Erythroxylum novogranatense]|uniref:EF-hand domain-containing protein n=1 Tax=Erythroxylum novogranatense TaxID=1862640 RepID=A0AAV8UI13_9ROSI|nr:hypothetical protein K2173_024936 [Erythroxylum novogranatense]
MFYYYLISSNIINQEDMLSHLRTCLTNMCERVQVKCKRRKGTKLCFSFDSLTSSLAAMDVPDQLSQVFKVIDANGDGKISSHELSQLLSVFGYNKSEATKVAEGMLREMDCDGDGFVDLNEFIDAVSGGEEEYLVDAFRTFDLDKNGLISARELQKVLSSLGSEDCSLRDCRLMIKGVDKDGDGFVDFKEFRSMMNSSRAI